MEHSFNTPTGSWTWMLDRQDSSFRWANIKEQGCHGKSISDGTSLISDDESRRQPRWQLQPRRPALRILSCIRPRQTIYCKSTAGDSTLTIGTVFAYLCVVSEKSHVEQGTPAELHLTNHDTCNAPFRSLTMYEVSVSRCVSRV